MDAQYAKLTTGRLFWKQSGEDSWIDFGNAMRYARKPRMERVKHTRKDDGFGLVDLNLVRETEALWEFVFDEQFGERLAPMYLGGAASLFVPSHAGTVIVLATATLAVGRTHLLTSGGSPVIAITAISISDGVITLVRDTHYTVDVMTGAVTVLAIPNPGANWTVTVSATVTPTFDRFAALAQILMRGTFKVIEKDQNSFVPVNEEEFLGQVYVSAWGENDLSKISEYTVEVLHSGV